MKIWVRIVAALSCKEKYIRKYGTFVMLRHYLAISQLERSKIDNKIDVEKARLEFTPIHP